MIRRAKSSMPIRGRTRRSKPFSVKSRIWRPRSNQRAFARTSINGAGKLQRTRKPARPICISASTKCDWIICGSISCVEPIESGQNFSSVSLRSPTTLAPPATLPVDAGTRYASLVEKLHASTEETERLTESIALIERELTALQLDPGSVAYRAEIRASSGTQAVVSGSQARSAKIEDRSRGDSASDRSRTR